jgi:thiol-disulfide isomerase/thioredoxin
MKLSHSLVALTLAVAALAAISLPAIEGANAAEVTAPRPAPSLEGGETWLNSPPLTAADLKGKVVLVDFWTYDCINCLNHLPFVRAWHDQYKDQGLVVVGVHTPEFAYERSTKNVQDAIRRLQVKHAVVQDNQFAIWKAFNNRYWPAIYLIDAQGRIVYQHFGEGAYTQTEAKIRELLAQRSGG